MLTRRSFLARSSLLAFGPLVPGFLARTAWAADTAKDTVLVVLEMNGGNDGLNTVVPYADDLYHKNRPSLRVTLKEVLKLNDEVGLHPSMASLHQMFQDGRLSVVQGVGYPNPDRSHFESMDIWQSADPKRQRKDGWLARSTTLLQDTKGNVPALHLSEDKTPLPLALTGAAGGVLTVSRNRPFRLELSGAPERHQARRKLIDDLSKTAAGKDDATEFVRRRQVQAYASMDRLNEILGTNPNAAQSQPALARNRNPNDALQTKFSLIAQMIAKGFGTRVFYVSIDGFDTHSNQGPDHARLLGSMSDAVANFFQTLGEHAKRVALMTFSEFGRRVKENGSRGTDHGAASCMFVAGVSGGLVGKHPKLADLDSGDLKYHTDFRSVYATLLDQWLGIDSAAVLGSKFLH